MMNSIAQSTDKLELINFYHEMAQISANISQILNEDGVTIEQIRILQTLKRYKDINNSKIAQVLKTSTAASSNKLHKLEDQGYISKQYGKQDDRRIVDIAVSPAGELIYRRFEQACETYIKSITESDKKISMPGLMQLFEMTNRLARSIRTTEIE